MSNCASGPWKLVLAWVGLISALDIGAMPLKILRRSRTKVPLGLVGALRLGTPDVGATSKARRFRSITGLGASRLRDRQFSRCARQPRQASAASKEPWVGNHPQTWPLRPSFQAKAVRRADRAAQQPLRDHFRRSLPSGPQSSSPVAGKSAHGCNHNHRLRHTIAIPHRADDRLSPLCMGGKSRNDPHNKRILPLGHTQQRD
jgi:hypothetical protein